MDVASKRKRFPTFIVPFDVEQQKTQTGRQKQSRENRLYKHQQGNNIFIADLWKALHMHRLFVLGVEAKFPLV